MNNEQITEIIKFDCKYSLKYLLEQRLIDEHLSTEAIKQIKEAYDMLELNLIEKLTDNTIF